MVKSSRPVEYIGGGIPQKYPEPKFKDQGNCFLWMACCSSSRQVHSEYWGACWDLQHCSTINFFPKEELANPEISECPSPNLSLRKNVQLIHAQENTTFPSSESVSNHSESDFSILEKDIPLATCNIIPVVQISDNPIVDGVVDTQIFWEVFVSGAWRKHSPRISEAIEKVFERLTPSVRENIDKNYENNWWRDSKFGDMFVYHSKNFQISPLYMLQRNILTGSFLNIRRKKVELHSRGFSLNHLGSSSMWTAERGSSTESQKCSTPEDKSSPKEKSPSKKHIQQKTKRRSEYNNCRNNELHSTGRSSKWDENLSLHQGHSKDRLASVNCKNWKTWNTAQIVTFLRKMNLHRYCDVVTSKGVTGKELSKMRKTDLIDEWGMAAYHSAQFLNALRKIEDDVAIQLESANSDCKLHSEQSLKHVIKSALQKSRDESRSYEWCPLKVEIAKPGITFGHASKESLILQHHDHVPGGSAVLFPTLRLDSQILKMKSESDAAAFSQSNVPSEGCYQRSTTFHSGHKYSLGSLIKSDNEDFTFSKLEESKQKDECRFDWALVNDEQMTRLSIPELQLRNSGWKTDQSLSSSYELLTTDDEEPLNLIYKSGASTICTVEIPDPEHSSYENSSESFKQPPKFELSAVRIYQESKHQEEDDNKNLYTSQCASSKFGYRIKAKSMSTPQSKETVCKTSIVDNHGTSKFSDRSDSEEVKKICARSRSFRLLNHGYPPLSVGSRKENLVEYQDLDDEVTALTQFLKGTKISFTSLVLETA